MSKMFLASIFIFKYILVKAKETKMPKSLYFAGKVAVYEPIYSK